MNVTAHPCKYITSANRGGGGSKLLGIINHRFIVGIAPPSCPSRKWRNHHSPFPLTSLCVPNTKFDENTRAILKINHLLKTCGSCEDQKMRLTLLNCILSAVSTTKRVILSKKIFKITMDKARCFGPITIDVIPKIRCWALAFLTSKQWGWRKDKLFLKH